MTIEQYLRGKVDFDLSDNTLAAVFLDRGIETGADATTLTERQRDLALADIYMFLATSSTSSTGEYESDGGWQHQKSAKNVYDRATFRALAKDLYAKWGETSASAGKIVFRSLY